MQWPLYLCRKSAYGQSGTIFLYFYIWRPDFECSQLRLIFECTIQDLGLLQKKENSNVKHESWKHLQNDLDDKHESLVIEQNFYVFSRNCSSSLQYMQGHTLHKIKKIITLQTHCSTTLLVLIKIARKFG